jgi:hypothetical protein
MKIPKKGENGNKPARKCSSETIINANTSAASKAKAKSKSSLNLVTQQTVLESKSPSPSVDPTEGSFSPAVSEDEDITLHNIFHTIRPKPKKPTEVIPALKVTETDKKKPGTNEQILADLERQKRKLGKLPTPVNSKPVKEIPKETVKPSAKKEASKKESPKNSSSMKLNNVQNGTRSPKEKEPTIPKREPSIPKKEPPSPKREPPSPKSEPPSPKREPPSPKREPPSPKREPPSPKREPPSPKRDRLG